MDLTIILPYFAMRFNHYHFGNCLVNPVISLPFNWIQKQEWNRHCLLLSCSLRAQAINPLINLSIY